MVNIHQYTFIILSYDRYTLNNNVTKQTTSAIFSWKIYDFTADNCLVRILLSFYFNLKAMTVRTINTDITTQQLSSSWYCNAGFVTYRE